MKRFTSVFLLISILLLCSCGENRATSTDIGFTDAQTGISYVNCAPMALYPVDSGKEFITVKDKNGTETVYYEIPFEDTSRFLCFKENGFLTLCRNAEVPEPTISEFNAVSADIYNSSNNTVLATFYPDAEYLPDELKEDIISEDTYLVRMITEYIRDNDNVILAAKNEDDFQDLFFFHLYSPDYPGLYYLVAFFGYNGRYFLRDGTANGKTVYCPYDIWVRMVGE